MTVCQGLRFLVSKFVWTERAVDDILRGFIRL